jgi:hypothetical protein
MDDKTRELLIEFRNRIESLPSSLDPKLATGKNLVKGKKRVTSSFVTYWRLKKVLGLDI